MEEQRVISLKKDRVITLSKTKRTSNGDEVSDNIKFVFTGLRWGKIKKGGLTKITRQVKETVYTGNWFQRFFKFGPKEERVAFEEYDDLRSVEFKDVDLDSSLVCYGKDYKIRDIIYYGRKENSYCKHYGDDVHGGGSRDVDNEIIRIELDKVIPEVEAIAVILNSYSHDKFDDIPFVQMRIYGSDMRDFQGNKINNLKTFAEYKIDNNPEFKGKEALVLGVFYRNESGWDFKAIGDSTKERDIQSMAKGSALKAVKSIY